MDVSWSNVKAEPSRNGYADGYNDGLTAAAGAEKPETVGVDTIYLQVMFGEDVPVIGIEVGVPIDRRARVIVTDDVVVEIDPVEPYPVEHYS